MYNKTIDDFTAVLSSNSPVPGGGGATALVGAIASSLAQMVTNLTTGKKKYAQYQTEIEEIMVKAEDLRLALLDLINRDAECFEPLAKLYSLPKDTEGYQEKMQKALEMAASAPMEILNQLTKVIDLNERLAVIGSKLALSDVATSVMFAYGGLYGALVNIKTNTRLMNDKIVAEKLEDYAINVVEKYAEKAKAVYDYVLERLA